VFVEADVGPEVDAKISMVRCGKEVTLGRHCQGSDRVRKTYCVDKMTCCYKNTTS
jgi:hypothetical protein